MRGGTTFFLSFVVVLLFSPLLSFSFRRMKGYVAGRKWRSMTWKKKGRPLAFSGKKGTHFHQKNKVCSSQYCHLPTLSRSPPYHNYTNSRRNFVDSFSFQRVHHITSLPPHLSPLYIFLFPLSHFHSLP